MKKLTLAVTALCAISAMACTKICDNSTVEEFDLSRYLGEWYEIARYDHCFERGMDNTMAEYILQDDGKVFVLNSGWKNGKFKVAEGKAKYVFYFIGVSGGASVDALRDPSQGAPVAFLNVFGPTFGNILNLFVAISCLGTLNGLMLACTRSAYALSARNRGPNVVMFSQIDDVTNMPTNSSIL